jgi:hypothetical protein
MLKTFVAKGEIAPGIKRGVYWIVRQSDRRLAPNHVLKQRRSPEPLPFVGASLLAKVVNDNAQTLKNHGALEFFASKLAPTSAVFHVGGSLLHCLLF